MVRVHPLPPIFFPVGIRKHLVVDPSWSMDGAVGVKPTLYSVFHLSSKGLGKLSDTQRIVVQLDLGGPILTEHGIMVVRMVWDHKTTVQFCLL